MGSFSESCYAAARFIIYSSGPCKEHHLILVVSLAVTHLKVEHPQMLALVYIFYEIFTATNFTKQCFKQMLNSCARIWLCCGRIISGV